MKLTFLSLALLVSTAFIGGAHADSMPGYYLVFQNGRLVVIFPTPASFKGAGSAMPATMIPVCDDVPLAVLQQGHLPNDLKLRNDDNGGICAELDPTNASI